MTSSHLILILLLTLLIHVVPASGQTIFMEEEEIPITSFQLDLASNPAEYAGDYHFGFSDGESNLHLVVKGTSVSGVLSYDVFNSRRNGFDKRTVKLKGGKITGNMLVADGWYGIFVRYKENRGLILFKAPTNMIGLGTEFGYKLSYEE